MDIRLVRSNIRARIQLIITHTTHEKTVQYKQEGITFVHYLRTAMLETINIVHAETK